MDEINRKTVWTYAAVVGVTIVGIILLNILNVRYPLSVTTSTVSTEFAVVGEANVEVIPNMAYVDVGISVSNVPTVTETEKRINETNNKIIVAMQRLGIDKKDVRTSNYSIYPNSVFEGGKEKTLGFSGNASLSIKVEKAQLIGQVITHATEAGANQIQGTRFEVDKPEIYREKARDKAIKNAREQAARLAKTLGIRLGKVVNIVESTPDAFPPTFQTLRAEKMSLGSPAPDIQPGSQTISSTVTLYFEKR